MKEKTTDISYFISFCIEQYKNEKQISGAEAILLLDKYGVLEYLQNHFEVLHTQNAEWLVEEIDEFIAARKEDTK